MKNCALTLTVVSRMTSNYSESLGNIGSVQKVFIDGKTYATRSKESLKNAIMVQSGLYDDMKVDIDGAAQKHVSSECNASNCRALEGGYMNTSGETKIRKSSIYVTDAVSCSEFVNETRFHNNLFLATRHAKSHGKGVQQKEDASGLMPYQYEYDKSMKRYSITIHLDQVGSDENYDAKADASERAYRVNAILRAIESLSLVVRGNLDNSEPLFVIGGIGEYKTHYFENVVRIKQNHFEITKELTQRLNANPNYKAGLLRGGNFDNEEQIESELKPISIVQFFGDLRREVEEYYGGSSN